MKTLAAAWLALVAFVAAAPAVADTNWVEGKHYVTYAPMHPGPQTPGVVSVVEVFSYACPACNNFHDTVDRLRTALPKNAKLSFVAAGFRADEDWPMFQRAYYTAQALGIDGKTHNAMFDAVWKSFDLGTMDPRSGQLRRPLPAIEDAAKFYARIAGVKADAFVSMAQSFDVDRRVREAEEYIKNHRVDHTPMIIVGDRYQTDPASAGGYDQLIELVKYLVAKSAH